MVECARPGRSIVRGSAGSEHSETVVDSGVAATGTGALLGCGFRKSFFAGSSRLEEEGTGKVSYRFEWCTHCHDFPLGEQCLGKDQRHRTVVVGQHHTQARRHEQQSKEFKDKAKARNAIEGTQSELVRAHGLRWAGYRGLRKVQLQNYMIGAACNIKRWICRLIWLMKQAARQSATVAVAS